MGRSRWKRGEELAQPLSSVKTTLNRCFEREDAKSLVVLLLFHEFVYYCVNVQQKVL